MGYYTCFNLSMESRRTVNAQEIYDYAVANDYAFADVFSVYDSGFDALEPAKWYEHEEEMRAISKQFPFVLFKLHGEGDSSDDLWDEYYQDGKMQLCVAEVVYPPFDPAKLE